MPVEKHQTHGRGFTAELRRVDLKYGPSSRVGAIVGKINEQSPEFVEIWAAHQVNGTFSPGKRLLNAEVGLIKVQCQLLQDPDQGQ